MTIRRTTSCRRQIEKSPLAQIEMSLSPVFESDGELAADDGDFDEPFGDRSDERFARSGGGADQRFCGSDAAGPAREGDAAAWRRYRGGWPSGPADGHR